MKTVAEGIETQEIADECMAMGLDFMQGYLYHRPELIKSAEPGTKLLNLQLSENQIILFFIMQRAKVQKLRRKGRTYF